MDRTPPAQMSLAAAGRSPLASDFPAPPEVARLLASGRSPLASGAPAPGLLSSIAESSPAGSQGLWSRIMERKRPALVDLNGNVEQPSHRRARSDDPQENPEEKIAVQRFTLVSRGAPPAKRPKVQHEVLLAPPRVAAQLGEEVQVCKCSQCDRSGLKRRMSGTRLCRRNTEAHPEYALLLSMCERFGAESSDHSAHTLVGEACCREKSAYFILGPESTTVGYVAAELAANRRVRMGQSSVMSDAGDTPGPGAGDNVPTILQVYVEPEYRRQGFATEALGLLLRDHDSVRVDSPSLPVLCILEKQGFTRAGVEEGEEGRQLISFVRRVEIFHDM